MNKLAIPHDAMIFVGDGRKALFLRNDGDEKFPNLKTEQVFADEIRQLMSKAPTSRARPLPTPARIGAAAWIRPTGITSRSIVSSSASPLHWRAWCEAARSLPSSLPHRRARSPTCAGLFHADVKKRIVAEVGKDLTNHPVSEIETHLLG